MIASVPIAATVPQIGERQPRVFPTARTMVNASTHSTTLARNAGMAAMASVTRAALPIMRRASLRNQLTQCYSCTSYFAPGLEVKAGLASTRIGYVPARERQAGQVEDDATEVGRGQDC